MFWKYFTTSIALLVHAAAAAPSHALMARQFASAAMMRFQCSQLVFDRIDPLVQPGLLPSTHMHQIVGGNAFNVSMPPIDLDPSLQATCTTCDFSEDLSNYWTANLYFKARNGTFKRVPQMVNLGLSGERVSQCIIFHHTMGKRKMLVGDAGLRAKQGQQKQLCHRCFSNKKQDPFGGAPCSGADTYDLPKKPCGGGIRTTITFPTVPKSGSFESNGPCPASHPVKMPQLMYEVMWDTTVFSDKAMWPADGSQPFVYSMGDKTGYGQHGDYLFGWKDGALQKALDQRCTGNTCNGLKTQNAVTSTKCAVAQSVKEPYDGCKQTPLIHQ
ncbi:hypothetical protein GQ44DRAFT_737584 [Phaeosphaeriaceae sp. PMI808]|nr:hypothetical protein GQ44DRAFT_737584 [Phaeosphaeriaceae sp. PMI808]